MTDSRAYTPTGPVLVTGGTGFLGRHLVERLLASGRTVSVLSRRSDSGLERRGVRFVKCPLEAPEAGEACAGIETVFHVAAKVGVWGKAEDFHRTNVLGTRTLLAGARKHGVRCFIHTSTPSVVYNGLDLRGADESLPLTTSCPSAYPTSKAQAEREVLAANTTHFRTVALRPHLIWGPDDPHLVPRLLARADAGRLRIIGSGTNRVDMVHVDNATEAHLLAEIALAAEPSRCAGKAYFISNDEPVSLWEWINGLLEGLGRPRLSKRLSLASASRIGSVCEALWQVLPLKGEPPMTRFIAAELAKDHWFDISAAKRDLNYHPRLKMAEATAALIEHLRRADAPPRRA